MEILRTVLTVLFILDCIGLSVIVLMQEGKSQGLGSIAGMADTYWGFSKSNKDYGSSVLCFSIGIESELLIMRLLHKRTMQQPHLYIKKGLPWKRRYAC